MRQVAFSASSKRSASWSHELARWHLFGFIVPPVAGSNVGGLAMTRFLGSSMSSKYWHPSDPPIATVNNRDRRAVPRVLPNR
jgi:hypothetical protein